MRKNLDGISVEEPTGQPSHRPVTDCHEKASHLSNRYFRVQEARGRGLRTFSVRALKWGARFKHVRSGRLSAQTAASIAHFLSYNPQFTVLQETEEPRVNVADVVGTSRALNKRL